MKSIEITEEGWAGIPTDAVAFTKADEVAWVDTKDVRPADSLAFAVLNDRVRKVSDAVQDALRSYDITPIAWSKREEFRERLAA